MRSVELFAGAGGLAIGTGRAGCVPCAVIERDRYCCDTLRENRQRGLREASDWPIVETDVRQVRYDELGDVDLVTGGPPCQPFSIGGKHQAFDDRRDMFPEAVRAVRSLSPKAFVFENVKGLTRTSFSNYFEYIRLQLTYPELAKSPEESWRDHRNRLERHHTSGTDYGLRYHVVTRLLNAADYGVPQRRERVFLVGIRFDVGRPWAFPDPTHAQDALLFDQFRSGAYWERHGLPTEAGSFDPQLVERARRILYIPQLEPWRTVRDAIADLPDPRMGVVAEPPFNHRFQPGARPYPGHTGSPLDEPAKTLKAGDHGVPGGENMLLRADGTVRYFTVRESARLQTFPDEYRFHGSWTEAMRQLGNAVPVRLAHVVVRSVIEQLDLRESPRAIAL